MSEASDKWHVAEVSATHMTYAIWRDGLAKPIEIYVNGGPATFEELCGIAQADCDRRNAELERAEVQPPSGFVFADEPTIADGFTSSTLVYHLAWHPDEGFDQAKSLLSELGADGWRWLAFAPSKREETLEQALFKAVVDERNDLRDKVKALKDQRIQLLGQIETLKAERNEEERQHMLTDDKVKELETQVDCLGERVRALSAEATALEVERDELKRSLGKANMENVSLRNVIDMVKRNKQPAPSNGDKDMARAAFDSTEHNIRQAARIHGPLVRPAPFTGAGAIHRVVRKDGVTTHAVETSGGSFQWNGTQWERAEANGVECAIRRIAKEIREDAAYAVAWHANISMAYYDANGDRQKAATNFIKQLFDVDVSGFDWAKSAEPPSNGVEWEEDKEGLFWWAWPNGSQWCLIKDRDGDTYNTRVTEDTKNRVRPKGWVRS